jgi:hypothetical protein
MKRLLIALTTLFCLLMPASALAYNPLGSACNSSGTAKNSAACAPNGSDPIAGPNGVLKKASLVIASIAGIAAIIIIIVGGLQYITSDGDPQKAASARSAIIGAGVGLVIIVGSEAIITFVVSKL